MLLEVSENVANLHFYERLVDSLGLMPEALRQKNRT